MNWKLLYGLLLFILLMDESLYHLEPRTSFRDRMCCKISCINSVTGMLLRNLNDSIIF